MPQQQKLPCATLDIATLAKRHKVLVATGHRTPFTLCVHRALS